MLAFPPISAALESVGTSVLTFLGKLNIWQLVALGLAIFALVQHFELAHARKQAVNYSRQRDEYKVQLDGISTKRNEQQVVTRDRIVTVTKTLKSADQKAKIVEAAPLPGQCKSPPEVLGADL